MNVPLCADEMQNRVMEATEIFAAKQKSASPIPAEVTRQAKGIAIVEVTKGGFGVSGSLGEGVLLAGTAHGWSAPSAFSMGGGSVGFQIGFETKRYIFILRSQAALETFISKDKLALDAKASATGGPDHVTEGTDILPDGDIYVYTSSGGVYAGAAIGGQKVSLDDDVNRDAYGRDVKTEDILSGKIKSPDYIKPLHELLTAAKKNLPPATKSSP